MLRHNRKIIIYQMFLKKMINNIKYKQHNLKKGKPMKKLKRKLNKESLKKN